MSTNSKLILKMAVVGIAWVSAIPLSAAVVVNEIAWMGTTESATNEWIELANTGNTATDLSGWILRIEGKKDIALSGTIASYGFYLIERTDDEAVPNIPADLVSSFGQGGLNNAGATLILIDGGGIVVETLVSGEAWSLLGGDNESKHTASRQGSAWVTSAPTPRSANSGATTTPEEDSGTSVPPSSNPPPASSESPSNSSEPPARITAEISGPNRVAVGAHVTFKGVAYGLQDEPIPNARLVWNFGDGATAEGRSVIHAYRHPGVYTLVLEAASGEHAGSDRITIEAFTPEVVISRVVPGSGGLIELRNDSRYELDLSYWIVQSGVQQFTFPQNTFITAGGTMILSGEVTRLSGDPTQTALLYPNRSEVARFKEEIKTIISESNHDSTPPPVATQAAKVSKTSEKPLAEEEQTSSVEDLPSSLVASIPMSNPPPTRWIFAVGGLVLLAFSGIFLVARRSEKIRGDSSLRAEDFTLEEEEIEHVK